MLTEIVGFAQCTFTEGAVKQHSEVYEYAFVLGMVDRVILKMLAYTGYILDGRANFARIQI